MIDWFASIEANPTKSIQELAGMLPSIEIRGKNYVPVRERVGLFRAFYGGDWSILTDIVKSEGEIGGKVVVKASIADAAGRIIAVGHSEQTRGDGPVNSYAPLENAETQAIGRALSNLGLAGGEYASADELAGLPANIPHSKPPPISLQLQDPPASGGSQRAESSDPIRNVGDDSMVEGTVADKEWKQELGSDDSGVLGEGPLIPAAWPAIASGMIAFLPHQEDLSDLNLYYRNNRPLLDEMKKKAPEEYGALMSAFTAWKGILTEKQAQPANSERIEL